MESPLAWIGAMVAVLCAGAGLVLPRRRASIAMALSLALCPALIAGDVWDTQRFIDLREDPTRIVAAVAGAAVAVGVLAATFVRWPSAAPLLAIAVLPFRIPVELGGETSNLLLPLYAVIAAWVAAEILGRAPDPEAGPAWRLTPGGVGSAVRWLPAVLAGWLLLYAAQSAYSEDFSKALQNLAFFYLPFAVLLGLLVRASWTERLWIWVFAIVVGEGLLFAMVGLAQLAVGELFWNDTVIAANDANTYFRVNSLFWDPNILGRYVAIALLVLCALILWTRSARTALLALAGGGLLLAVLLVTYSQSSQGALLAGMVMIAGLRWSVRWAAIAAGTAVVAAIAAVAASGSFDLDLGSRKLNVETSGRAELIRGGVELAGEMPIVGHGSGSFGHAFAHRYRGTGEAAAVNASHTEPVTVAAEQGATGFVLYLGFLGTSLAALVGGIGAVAPGARGPAREPPPDSPQAVARIAVAAAFVAMVVHSLSYAAFFSDPITWALLGVGLALARGGRAAVEAPAARPVLAETPTAPN